MPKQISATALHVFVVLLVSKMRILLPHRCVESVGVAKNRINRAKPDRGLNNFFELNRGWRQRSGGTLHDIDSTFVVAPSFLKLRDPYAQAPNVKNNNPNI